QLWGGRQLVCGPVLEVPYRYPRGGMPESRYHDDGVASFLPEKLVITGSVEPEIRLRGIHEAVVYTAKLRVEGTLQPDFVATGIEFSTIDWEKARLIVGVSDARGIRSIGAAADAENEIGEFQPLVGAASSVDLLAARCEPVEGKPLSFAFDLVFQGSGGLQLSPVGKTTKVELKSPWPDPSFDGACLPVSRQVRASGFLAVWEAVHFSRGFPQHWTNRDEQRSNIHYRIAEAAFGVSLARPVDGYRLVERARKFGILFFVLVFAVYFLFEATAGLRIHPLQYAMVGAALCLFFLCTLALSEFISAGAAYVVAGSLCTLMIALYSWAFLETGRRAWIVGGGLGLTYAYLFFVLKSQDFALLAGTAALFAVLAAGMFLTRRMDRWHGNRLSDQPAQPCEATPG
ncbi:MAG: cell envelope integrity protein CreD, partial [Akkermansiaceae bacterium]|nr:cell envelope integrity protein CreD [Akkermansiaceae bacterium]